jgi:hypothetical protein
MIDAFISLPAFACSRQYTAAWCVGAKWPLRCTLITLSHSASVMLMITRSRRMPALFTSTCNVPKVSIACWMRRCAPSQSATLSPLTTASPPIALISSTTCCAGVASLPLPSFAPPRSLTTTLAPSDANSSACSRPMPRPAPVMIATRPSSVPISFPLAVVVRGSYFFR